jgi:hypothetical protein
MKCKREDSFRLRVAGPQPFFSAKIRPAATGLVPLSKITTVTFDSERNAPPRSFHLSLFLLFAFPQLLPIFPPLSLAFGAVSIMSLAARRGAKLLILSPGRNFAHRKHRRPPRNFSGKAARCSASHSNAAFESLKR